MLNHVIGIFNCLKKNNGMSPPPVPESKVPKGRKEGNTCQSYKKFPENNGLAMAKEIQARIQKSQPLEQKMLFSKEIIVGNLRKWSKETTKNGNAKLFGEDKTMESQSRKEISMAENEKSVESVKTIEREVTVKVHIKSKQVNQQCVMNSHCFGFRTDKKLINCSKCDKLVHSCRSCAVKNRHNIFYQCRKCDEYEKQLKRKQEMEENKQQRKRKRFQ